MLANMVALNGTLVVFVCVLLSSFLLLARSSNRVANTFFAGFLLLLAIDVLGWVISDPRFSGSWLDAFRVATVLLQMPLYLGFILAMLFHKFNWRWHYVLQGLPFLVALLLTAEGQQLALLGEPVLEGYLLEREAGLVFAMIDLQYYLYIAVAVFYLFQFRRISHTYYSGAQSKTFMWLCSLVGVSLLANVLNTIKSLAATPQSEGLFQVMQLLMSFTTLAVVSGFILSALLMPELFRSVDKGLVNVAEHFTDDKPERHESHLKETISDFMYQHQPYLRQDLSLQELASLLGVSQHKLSVVINSEFGDTFFNFVNRYRVAYVQSVLVSKPSRGITEIFYDAGFSSKSSFNTAFRKITGTTPSAFRKLHLSKG